ncbi:MAG TPA: hypothetical protein VM123_02555 [archaeon]|nr:hypothetical protein [archaeon]
MPSRPFFSLFKPAVLLCAVFVFASCGAKPQFGSPAAPAPPRLHGWTVIGPGGGGAQFIPTINPYDRNNVFVRCDMTAAYVTADGGENWRMFNLRTVVRDFEFDPGDPNTVYACNTGLYRSSDRGKAWELILPDPAKVTGETMSGDHAGQRFITSDNESGGSISLVRVDPQDSRRITIAMSGPGFRSGGSRILTSADRGKTWRQVAEVEGREVLGIFPGSWGGNSGQVVILTSEAGYRVSLEGSGSEKFELPVDQAGLADGGKGAAGSLLYLLGARGGIYRSRDLGRSWEKADQSLAVSDQPQGRFGSRYRALAACEGTPEVVYLSCGGMPVDMNGYQQRVSGILKSTDAGRSWVLEVCGGEVLSKNYEGGWLIRNLGWFGSPSHAGVSPSEPDVCYCTDSGRTFRTLDGGKTWKQVISRDFPDLSFTTRGLDVTTDYGVHFDPYNPDHFFITYTDIGLFHTFNFGKSWYQSITGIPQQWRNTCYWLEFDPAVKGRIYSVWSNVHDLPRPKMHRSGNLVSGNQQGGVAVSGDGGRNWGILTRGELADGDYIHRMRLAAVPTHIVIDPKSSVRSRTLYVCDYGWGVWKSTDGGRTWEIKKKGIDPANLNCWRITRLPSGRLILLVVRAGLEGREQTSGALYVSDDGAESWQMMPLPERVTMPNDLVFDPTDPDRMYLSCWPLNVGGRALPGEPQQASVVEGDQLEAGRREIGGGLFRTEDGGKTWKQVFDEKMHVYAAAVDPENPNTVVINTFHSSAFRSDDRGENWKRLGGYNFKWGHRPVFDPVHPGMLFLTSFGGSVFYGPAEGVSGVVKDIINLPKVVQGGL